MNHSTEKDEIAFIENEAFLDRAINDLHKSMSEALHMKAKIEDAIQKMEVTLGTLVGYKILFSTVKKESHK